jgi:hypothetical protein
MELKRAIAITTFLAMLLVVTIVTAQQMTSTVNPNVPVPNTPVEQSGPLFRSNFQAVINDINELFRRTGPSPRIKLAAQLDLYADYVAGNDANPCSMAQPCKTAQHAYNNISLNYDTAGQNVTIHLVNNDPACLAINTGWAGAGQIAIIGPGANNAQPTVGFVGCPSNGVAINTTLPAAFNLFNLVVTSAAGGASVLHLGTGVLILSNVAFGSAGNYHVSAIGDGAKIVCLQNSTLTMTVASSANWVSAQSAASFFCPSVRFVFLGSQAYGAVVQSINTSPVALSGSPQFCANYGSYGGACTAVSAVTGPRFLAMLNGVVDTETNGNAGCGSGSGLTTIPGNSAGVCLLGGQYN